MSNEPAESEVIVLLAGDDKARKKKIGRTERITRDEWFPGGLVPDGLMRHECSTTMPVTGQDNYYAVFYDGHDRGKPNPIAKWIAKILRVKATGNFVFCHKVWIDGEETNADIRLTLQELKALFSSGFNSF